MNLNDLPSGMEKRRYVRVPIAFDPHYDINRLPEVTISSDGRNECARLVDISKGGISLISNVEFPRGKELDVSFELEMKKAGVHKISATGIVRFCSPKMEHGIYQIGLEFVRIDQEQKDLIIAYVDSFF